MPRAGPGKGPKEEYNIIGISFTLSGFERLISFGQKQR
jgi:hypothetical protein